MKETYHYVSDLNRVGVTACQRIFRIGNFHATNKIDEVTCKSCLKKINKINIQRNVRN